MDLDAFRRRHGRGAEAALPPASLAPAVDEPIEAVPGEAWVQAGDVVELALLASYEPRVGVHVSLFSPGLMWRKWGSRDSSAEEIGAFVRSLGLHPTDYLGTIVEVSPTVGPATFVRAKVRLTAAGAEVYPHLLDGSVFDPPTLIPPWSME